MTAIIVSAPAALREQLDRVTGKMELPGRPAARADHFDDRLHCPALAGG
jgi:hypothetical protein